MKVEHDELLELFVKEANKYPVLTKEQEVKYTKQYKKNPTKALENLLVASNLRFVLKTAHQYSGYGLSMIDLVQEGNIGLLSAVRKFDPDRGFRLITYAVWWIRAHIQNYIMRNWSLVKVGTTQYDRILFYKLRGKRSEMEATLGREVTLEELSLELQISADKIEDLENRMKFRDVSLDAKLDIDDARCTFLDMTPSEEPNALELSQLKQERIRIHQAIFELMKSLKPKERVVVLQRLMSEEPKTLQELGEAQGVSRERIRQIEANVLRKLKVVLEKFEDAA